jgi:hypothetical protein
MTTKCRDDSELENLHVPRRISDRKKSSSGLFVFVSHEILVVHAISKPNKITTGRGNRLFARSGSFDRPRSIVPRPRVCVN